MKIIEKENFKIVTPTENMLICNRSEKIISDELKMPLGAGLAQWEEISEEEKQRLEAEWETEMFEEATEQDYQNALKELGVKLNE